MNKLQCPNCGGYVVEDLHKITCIDYALILAFGVGILIILYKLRKKPKNGFNEYVCRLCNQVWIWKPGTPYPEVHVRPDLIAKGEKKLREEQDSQLE
jgi:hypothetical protein